MAQTGYTPLLIYSSSTVSQAPAAGNLTNSTLGSELAINITDGKLFYKDNANNVQVIAWKVTPTTAGGTGLTSYTTGDTLYYASGTALSKLAIGGSGYYMSSSGTAPQWSAPAALTKTDDTNVTLTLGGSASTALLNAASLTLGWTGQLAVTRGGTGLSTVAQGDILYGSAANTLSALAKNTTATRYLSNTGTSNNPAWAQINLANGVTGTLPTANGGTGLTSFTANGVVYASSTSALATSTNLSFDGNNVAVGATLSAWGTGASTYKAIQFGSSAFVTGRTGNEVIFIGSGAYNDGTDWRYSLSGNNATYYAQFSGQHAWYRAGTGTAGNVITFSTVMETDASSNVKVNAGNVVVGTAGKGIDFSANSHAAGMTSELLTWYEEGTFTPTIFGTGVAGTPTYTTQVGRYTRIGRVVYIQLQLAWSAFAGATGAMKVGGLPFTSNASVTSQLSVGTYDLALTANNFLLARIETSTTEINLLESPTGGGAWNTIPIDTNVIALEISGCYTV